MLPTVPFLVDRGQAIGTRGGTGEPGGECFAGLQALRQAGAGGERQQQQSGGAEGVVRRLARLFVTRDRWTWEFSFFSGG